MHFNPKPSHGFPFIIPWDFHFTVKSKKATGDREDDDEELTCAIMNMQHTTCHYNST